MYDEGYAPEYDEGYDPEYGEYGEGYDEPILYDEYPQAAPYKPCEPGTSGEWLRNGYWYADASVLYMDRLTSGSNSVPLSAEFFPGSTVQVANLKVQQDLGYQPGMQISLGRYLGATYATATTPWNSRSWGSRTGRTEKA